MKITNTFSEPIPIEILNKDGETYVEQLLLGESLEIEDCQYSSGLEYQRVKKVVKVERKVGEGWELYKPKKEKVETPPSPVSSRRALLRKLRYYEAPEVVDHHLEGRFSSKQSEPEMSEEEIAKLEKELLADNDSE